jgi:hypothetical protein
MVGRSSLSSSALASLAVGQTPPAIVMGHGQPKLDPLNRCQYLKSEY